jgi:6-pyruvoyltetrahydropterin/6-carboxytetrahydropterin synthase
MKYEVIKTIPHSKGWSVCFRQWRAESHCKYLHGYALQVSLTFGSDSLDARNWVIDFGGFKDLFSDLEKVFDHTLIIALDDPLANDLLMLQPLGAAQVLQLPKVGCEGFAESIALWVIQWMRKSGIRTDVRLLSVEVREHEGNGAIYRCA